MYLNIAAYKFVTLNEDELISLCENLKAMASQLDIKGTILLSREGINLFLAGQKDEINQFQLELASFKQFSDLFYKSSNSDFIPFKKLSVKIREEIVTFKQPEIDPEHFTAPYITPETLKAKLEAGETLTLLDTRNKSEFDIGAFSQATHLSINNFRDFPDALEKSLIPKNQPIVTYCTGGIRCEKAAAYLLKKGYTEVYQLYGGIIHYFEKCGGKYFEGNCFVFDDRIALNSRLEPHIGIVGL